MPGHAAGWQSDQAWNADKALEKVQCSLTSKTGIYTVQPLVPKALLLGMGGCLPAVRLPNQYL